MVKKIAAKKSAAKKAPAKKVAAKQSAAKKAPAKKVAAKQALAKGLAAKQAQTPIRVKPHPPRKSPAKKAAR